MPQQNSCGNFHPDPVCHPAEQSSAQQPPAGLLDYYIAMVPSSTVLFEIQGTVHYGQTYAISAVLCMHCCLILRVASVLLSLGVYFVFV